MTDLLWIIAMALVAVMAVIGWAFVSLTWLVVFLVATVLALLAARLIRAMRGVRHWLDTWPDSAWPSAP